MGHSDVNTVFEYYQHTQETLRKKAVKFTSTAFLYVPSKCAQANQKNKRNYFRRISSFVLYGQLAWMDI